MCVLHWAGFHCGNEKKAIEMVGTLTIKISARLGPGQGCIFLCFCYENNFKKIGREFFVCTVIWMQMRCGVHWVGACNTVHIFMLYVIVTSKEFDVGHWWVVGWGGWGGWGGGGGGSNVPYEPTHVHRTRVYAGICELVMKCLKKILL